jgi:hypothetical protein
VKNVFSLFRRFALALLATGALSHCSLRDQVSETPTGPSLKFSLVRIDEASLGGLDARAWRQPADVNLAQRSQLIQGYVNGNLPLRMSLLLDVRDPSLSAQNVSSIDYEVFLDDKLLGSEQVTPNVVLPAGGAAASIPLSFEFNTNKVLGKDALPALRNFAVGLADRRRRPIRLGLRLRPTYVTNDGRTIVLKNMLLVETDSVTLAQTAVNN